MALIMGDSSYLSLRLVDWASKVSDAPLSKVGVSKKSPFYCVVVCVYVNDQVSVNGFVTAITKRLHRF